MCVCVCVFVCVCDRAFSMFSHRKIAESSCFFCSVIFQGWWLSFEPNFEAQLALEVPQRAFRPSFSHSSHSRDRRFDLAGSAFDFDRLSAADIDAVLSPVFGKRPPDPKHAFEERSKNSVVLHANAQFRALEKPPFWPSFSTGALSFRECPLFGVQPVLAAFVTTLQLGTLPV